MVDVFTGRQTTSEAPKRHFIDLRTVPPFFTREKLLAHRCAPPRPPPMFHFLTFLDFLKFVGILGPPFLVLHRPSLISRPQNRNLQTKWCKMNVESASHAFVSTRSGPWTECTLPCHTEPDWTGHEFNVVDRITQMPPLKTEINPLENQENATCPRINAKQIKVLKTTVYNDRYILVLLILSFV